VRYIDESSDSDEEEIVIQRKPAKGKGRAGAAAASAPSEDRMAELEAAFEAMSKQKKATLIQHQGKGAVVPKYDILNM
jgi:hypothetical protein